MSAGSVSTCNTTTRRSKTWPASFSRGRRWLLFWLIRHEGGVPHAYINDWHCRLFPWWSSVAGIYMHVQLQPSIPVELAQPGKPISCSRGYGVASWGRRKQFIWSHKLGLSKWQWLEKISKHVHCWTICVPEMVGENIQATTRYIRIGFRLSYSYCHNLSANNPLRAMQRLLGLACHMYRHSFVVKLYLTTVIILV